MKREMLGINNTIPLKIAQDSLNPILRQTIKRIITIDSIFLPNSIPYSFKTTGNNSNENTNFSITLSETLKNVLSIKLLSINIPSTDYTFDTHKANTSFYIQYSTTKDFTDCSCVKVSIRPGNYNTAKTIIDEINFDISYCSNISNCNNQLNDLSGLRLTIQNENVEDKIVQFLNFSDYYINIIFYDPKFDERSCCGCSGDIRSSNACRKNATYKECLGYILGYRINTENRYSLDIILPPFCSLDPSQNLVSLQGQYFNALSSGNDSSLNNIMNSTMQLLWTQKDYYNDVIGGTLVKGVGSVSINLYGGSYILFTLDDHTNNYPTNGMIGINPPETKLNIPKYRDKIVDPSANFCDTSNNSQIIPTFPRTLTQSQLYALNSIINNRKETNTDILAPNPTDLFALLPRSSIKSLNSKAIVYNNPNTLFTRKYFGPITLEKLSIKLIDTYGNLINLNGHSWTFTLEAEQLYQY